MLVNNEEVFKSFAFYGTLSMFKMIGLAAWTGKTKRATQSFINKEDAERHGLPEAKTNEDVQRVQRAHRNEIENLLPFLGLGLFYCATRPCKVVAKWHFRVFVIARFIHSVAYINCKSKERSLGFGLGALVCLSMAGQCVAFFYKYA